MSLSTPGFSPARQRRVLPGFGLTMGVTLTYLGIIVLIPVAALVVKGRASGRRGSGTS